MADVLVDQRPADDREAHAPAAEVPGHVDQADPARAHVLRGDGSGIGQECPCAGQSACRPSPDTPRHRMGHAAHRAGRRSWYVSHDHDPLDRVRQRRPTARVAPNLGAELGPSAAQDDVAPDVLGHDDRVDLRMTTDPVSNLGVPARALRFTNTGQAGDSRRKRTSRPRQRDAPPPSRLRDDLDRGAPVPGVTVADQGDDPASGRAVVAERADVEQVRSFDRRARRVGRDHRVGRRRHHRQTQARVAARVPAVHRGRAEAARLGSGAALRWSPEPTADADAEDHRGAARGPGRLPCQGLAGAGWSLAGPSEHLRCSNATLRPSGLGAG